MSPDDKERKRTQKKEFGDDTVKEEADARKKKISRQRMWNLASVTFGGIAIAYGVSTEEHFATAAGAVIAAMGAIRLLKRSGALQQSNSTTPS